MKEYSDRSSQVGFNQNMNGFRQVLTVFFVAFGIFISALTAAAQSRSSAAIQPEAWQIVELENQARAAVGAARLKWDPALAAAAHQHCLRMAAEGPIAHQYPGEPQLTERAAHAGAHFSLIEENVAQADTPAMIHSAWMHSPPHRKNLLNPEVDRVGIAIVASRGTLYAVADYERVVAVYSQAETEATIAGLVQSRGVKILRDPSAARLACATDEDLPRTRSGPQARFVMRWQNTDLAHLPQELTSELSTGHYREAAVGSCPSQTDQGAFTAYRLAVLLY